MNTVRFEILSKMKGFRDVIIRDYSNVIHRNNYTSYSRKNKGGDSHENITETSSNLMEI